MSDYTPGPWEITGQKSHEEYWVTKDHYQSGPAKIIYKIEDAHLISAAPDLFEALAEIVCRSQPGVLVMLFGEQWATLALEALNKAMGLKDEA